MLILQAAGEDEISRSQTHTLWNVSLICTSFVLGVFVWGAKVSLLNHNVVHNSAIIQLLVLLRGIYLRRTPPWMTAVFVRYNLYIIPVAFVVANKLLNTSSFLSETHEVTSSLNNVTCCKNEYLDYGTFSQ